VTRILVGVDGSPESMQALRWAHDEAALRNAELVVCYAYGPPEEHNPYALSYTASLRAAEAIAEGERAWRSRREAEVRERAEGVLDGIIRDALPNPRVRVTPLLALSDRPPRALIRYAKDADLLVVGSRGRGGFKGLVLGSVSQQVAQHAPCPVVIVRPTG
jgi:nucleotide-binding universal stress UspA family protein